MNNKIPNWKYNFNNKWDYVEYCFNHKDPKTNYCIKPCNWIEKYKMRGRTKRIWKDEILLEIENIQEYMVFN